jgi:hypothetical protein
MSISELRPRPGPAEVLAEVVAAVRDLDATWWTSVSDDDLVAAVELVEQARSALAAVQTGAVAEADHRGLAKATLAYRSTGDWLTHLGGLRKGEGRRLVARAHALTGPLASTREAMAAGHVSTEQADIVVRSIDQLPLGDAVRSRGERVLLEHAGRFDATDLARTGRHLVHVVDPDGMERMWERQLDREERAAHHSRYLTITNDGAGGVRIKGRGSAEDGALIKAALQPLTTPTPALDDGQDGQDGQVVHDPRDAGARMWDALTRVAQHALDTDLPPQTHGAPARLTVPTTLESLQTGVPDPRLSEALDQDLSVATLRRLACDAEIIPAVLGTKSEPLDVGRTRRLVTLAIWTALLLRDHHCAFPACDRPPLMCHAHHITHWAHGGETNLDNLVLLCGHHHRTLHHTPWKVRLNPEDRKPEFKPPPKPGIDNTWIRHRPRRE